MKKLLVAISLIAIAVGTASAAVYRAGLLGGYINSYEGGKYTSSVIPDIGMFNGPVAARESSRDLTVTTYPPTWVNHRTWCYHGQMYFDGGTYYFGKNIDDATFIKVNRGQVLKDENHNKFVATPAIKLDPGWYDVEFRMGNGTGGAGCSNGTKGRDGSPLGLGYIHYASDEESTPAPTKMEELDYPADPGDGSFYRLVDESADYIKINYIEKKDGGYTFNITSLAPSPSTVTVFADAGSDGGQDPAAWGSSGSAEFGANETKDVFVEYASERWPYYIIKLTGVGTTLAEGEGVTFWQWSDVGSCTMEPTVSPVIGAVTPSSALFAVTLGYRTTIVGVEQPTMALKAHYGETDAGADGTWDFTADFGDANSAGSYDCELKNLDKGKTYYVRFAAKTVESDWIWSECLSFSTSGLNLEAPASVYENDPTEQAFKVVRPDESSAESLTVFLSYSGATDKVTQLPPSVTFDAGVSEVRVPFTMIDDELSTGDATLTLTIDENAAYVRGEPYTVDITILDDEASADEITWTGAAGDNKWESAGNWNPERVPTVMDTAVFTNEGLESGGTVTIASEAACRILKISRLDAMTLGGTGSLRLGGVTRVDLEGNEGNHDLNVAFQIFPVDGMESPWSIAGGNALRIYGLHTAAVAGTTLVKTGAGIIELRYKDTAFSGPWDVREGQIKACEEQSLCGTVYVGNYETKATVSQTVAQGFKVVTYPYVYSNGTFSDGNKNLNNGRCTDVRVFRGGVVSIGDYFYSVKAFFSGGGTINGGRFYNGGSQQRLSYEVGDGVGEMASFNCKFRISGSYDFAIPVEDGAAPVDLIATKNFDNGNNGKTLTKSGEGTFKTTSNWDIASKVAVSGGRWFVDNATGSGTGSQAVSVTGGLLGGVGTIYGANANVTASNSAKIAPGTVDTVTGVHSNGTFTVGNADNANSVTFNGNSILEVAVGEGRVNGRRATLCDKLNVFGAINIAGAGATLSVVPADPEQGIASLKSGEFVIAEAAGGINGTFANVTVPEGAKWKVRYEENKIILSIPARGFMVLVK